MLQSSHKHNLFTMDDKIGFGAKTAATVLVVAATVAITRRQSRCHHHLAIRGQKTGTVRLTPCNFGNEAEMFSDATRACNSGGVQLFQLALESPARASLSTLEVLSPLSADDETRGHLTRHLCDVLRHPDSEEVSELVALRVVSMLSIGPALAVLQSLGCLSMFQNHRFVVVRSASGLRVIVLGYVGAPGRRRSPRVLEIISDNLLEEEEGDRSPVVSSVHYMMRRAASRSNETEEEIKSSLARWVQEYR